MGCASGKIKRAIPLLDAASASYLGTWVTFGPTWYSLYSILPGQHAMHCNGGVQDVQRAVSMRNCARASATQVDELATQLDRAQGVVSGTFEGRIRFARVKYVLAPAGVGRVDRSSGFLHPSRLAFEMTVRFDPARAQQSSVDAVRAMAHEVYHMAMVARLRTEGPEDLPEETRASLFGACIEQQTFGAVAPDAIDPAAQSDPRALARQPQAHRSATGALQASRMLSAIAGGDGVVAGPSELAELTALCRNLVAPPTRSQAGSGLRER